MIKVYFQPQTQYYPERGGVRTHLVQLRKHLQSYVEFVNHPNDADILHVESAYPIPDLLHTTGDYIPPAFKIKRCVYVCHGGFLPEPLPVVIDNLNRADVIVSVAQWMVDRFFKPEWAQKTVVIPNGIDLDDFKNLPSNNLEPGFILYAKEWEYYFEDFLNLVYQRQDWQFVTTIWPKDRPVPFNVKWIGLQSKDKILSILKKAGCLLLTGSEVCPTMLLEAWALGVPVVAKNIDGSKELMTSKFGFSLYNGDIIPVIEQNLRKDLTIDSKGISEAQCYQWKDLVKKYVEVYEKVLGE